MAREYDEHEQRRRRRAAQKKQRQEEQALKRKLIIAAAVFIACITLVIFLTRDNVPEETLPEIQEGQTEETMPEFTERATLAPETPTTTIRIKAAGDLNITDKVVAAGASGYGDDYYDYTYAFLDVASLLSDADLTLMNLEGNLVGPPYGTETRSAPQQLLTALNNIGVDILQVANSYSTHNGMIGLAQTLNNIRAAGIEPVGAYATPDEFRQYKGYTICDIRGVKVAVVAFTKGMGGLGLPEGSEECVNKLFIDYDSEYKKIDYDGIRAILKNLRNEKPDVTIAMLHWGAEYNDTIFKSQKEIAELMIGEGVDVILGTHSHMVHEVVVDKDKNTVVAYSLGDFFGDASKAGTMYSIVLDIRITKDNDLGTIKIDSVDYVPIYTLSETENHGQRRVVRIYQSLEAFNVNFVDKVTQEAYDAMVNSLERIEARTDPAAWEAKQEALKKAAEEAAKETNP